MQACAAWFAALQRAPGACAVQVATHRSSNGSAVTGLPMGGQASPQPVTRGRNALGRMHGGDRDAEAKAAKRQQLVDDLGALAMPVPFQARFGAHPSTPVPRRSGTSGRARTAQAGGKATELGGRPARAAEPGPCIPRRQHRTDARPSTGVAGRSSGARRGAVRVTSGISSGAGSSSAIRADPTLREQITV